MERLFKVRYWDYSDQRFNLHGYICLTSSIAWGFLTIFMTEVIHKPIERFVLNLPPALEWCLLGVISGCFVMDTIQSTKEALNPGQGPGECCKAAGRAGRYAGAACTLKS